LEDNVKSSAPLAVAGVLGCILIAGCFQTREANVPSPPVTSYQVGSFELQESGSSQKIRGASVTPVFFQSAKIPTLLGRGFLPVDYGSGTQQVVMVSHRLWQKRFRGDPRIIGISIRVNGQAFTVIGIMPTTFNVPPGVDIWVPTAG
jgi:putative ABC transport system permease protein